MSPSSSEHSRKAKDNAGARIGADQDTAKGEVNYAKSKLDDLEFDTPADDARVRGHKSSLKNPNVSEEAKEHSRQVLEENDALPADDIASTRNFYRYNNSLIRDDAATGRQAASTRAEVDLYLAEDLRTSRVYLPFETFLKKVLNLPEDWESNVEFQRCLTALEGNNALREKLDTYLAACDADGVENTLYAPAASLYNEATSVMADTEGSDISSTIYAYRQDPKRVVGSRASAKGDRSPDLGGVLYALGLDSLNDLDRVNREGPSPKFSWEQLLLFWEFKKDHDLVDQGVGAPTVHDKNGQDPRDPAVLTKAKKDLIVASSSSITSTGATKRGSDSNKPVAKRQKGTPSSVASRSDITSAGSLESSRDLTFDDANDDRKTTAYQCANYALDFLSASGFEDHSLGLLVCDEEIQLMYHDHSCIAISAPLNVRSSRRMFMVLQASLHKAQQAALRNRGIVGRLFPNPSPYLRNYAEYKKIAGKDLNNILSGQFIQLQDTDGEFLVKLGRIIDRQTGIIGRCTQSEATFVNRIREVVAEKDDASWVLNHIPTILHSQDFVQLPDEVGGRLAAYLNDPTTQYASGIRFKYENRVLRVSVHEKLHKFSELDSVFDYTQVIFDVLQVHRWIYDHARILHRDISQGNIMWHIRGDRVCGVLNDFDLSSFRDSTSPSSKQRTGTRPYMARELHQNPAAPPLPLYRHDLESLFYVFWLFVVNNILLEEPTYHPTTKEPCYLAHNPSSTYHGWLQGSDAFLVTAKRDLEHVEMPAAHASLAVLCRYIFGLKVHLFTGLVAQSAHITRSHAAQMNVSVPIVRLKKKNTHALPPAPLPVVPESRLPPFDEITLNGHWTYARFFQEFSDPDRVRMYPVALPDN